MSGSQDAMRRAAIEAGAAAGWVEALVGYRMARGASDREAAERVTRESLAQCPTWILEALTTLWRGQS